MIANNSLATDSKSPLTTITNLYLQQLHITGTDANNRPTIFVLGYMQIFSKAKKIYIENVVFNGKFALKSDCSVNTCFYCPTIISVGNGVYRDDHWNYFTNTSNYGTSCSNYNSINFITVADGSALYLINVNVEYFQQQYNSFVYAQGAVSLSHVNFDRIQAYSQGA